MTPIEPSQIHATPKEAENPFFKAWAQVVLKWRAMFLLLTFGVTALFGYHAATKTRIDNSIEAFASTNSNAQDLLEQFRDEFGQDGFFLVMARGDVFSRGFLQDLKKLHEELAAIDMELPSLGERKADRDRVKAGKPALPQSAKRKLKEATPAVAAVAAPEAASATTGEDDDFAEFGDDESAEGLDSFGDDADKGWGNETGGTIIDETISLINVRETSGKGGTLTVGELMDPLPQASELAELRERILNSDKYVGQVVGRKGKHAIVAVRTQFMNEDDSAKVYFEILKISKRHEKQGFSIGVAGPPALGAALNELMLSDLKRTGLIAILAMLCALFFLFRHPMGVIGPLGVVLQAAVWTFGAMAWSGFNVTMLSNILPAFLVCVGIGDSVHLQSVYRDARKAGKNNHDAIVYSVSTTAIPVLFTTLTTMVGLLSFRFASVTAISDMGTAGAWGVFVALVHSLVFLPIMLSFNKRSLLGAQGAGGSDALDRFLDVTRRFSFDEGVEPGAPLGRKTPRRIRALLLVVAIFVLAGGMTSMLQVFHHPITWIPEDRAVRLTFEELDEEVGGTANVQLLFEAKEGRTIKDLQLLKGMERLDAHIRSYINPKDNSLLVGNTVSLLDVIKETNQALHDDDPKFYRLPETDRGISDLLFMFENAGPEQLRRLATNDLSKTQMSIRVRWVDATSYGGFTEHIAAGIKEHIGDRAVVKATGAIYSLFSVIANLIGDLIHSFGVAFFAITLMMIVMLRDVKLGLIAMVPNLLPIIVIMGGMALIGLPIDMSTLLIGSIALGIAVDDTIHLLHHFYAHYSLNGDVEAAIAYTFGHSGRAMVSTSVILCGGFCVYMTADMYNIGRFGALVAATVVLALMIDLLFAPALLRTFYKDRTPRAATGEA
ncbi:MAG TPA: hypothetical protein DCQ06_08560 [Myxococcales bacterium]|nr:hypothetical protein [Myxococcales bacterium]